MNEREHERSSKMVKDIPMKDRAMAVRTIVASNRLEGQESSPAEVALFDRFLVDPSYTLDDVLLALRALAEVDAWSGPVLQGDPSASPAWREASCLMGLITLTRDFVLDGSQGHPVPGAVDVDALRAVRGPFSRLSQRGLLVVDAQDGGAHDGVERRGFVSLVCSEGDAEELVVHASKAGLLAGMWSPHLAVADVVPVERSGNTTTRTAGVIRFPAIDAFEACVGVDAGIALSDRGFRVLVVDPAWGREMFLWEQLDAFIRTSHVHPAGPPRTSLDVDASLMRHETRARRSVDAWIAEALRELGTLARVPRAGAGARTPQGFRAKAGH